MTPAELSRTVLGAVRRAVEAGELTAPVPPDAAVERPRQAGRGDYATGIAMRLAGPAGLRPRQVAEILARRLAAAPGIARVDIAGPGFLNVTLAATAHADLVRAVREQGPRYGHADTPDTPGTPRVPADLLADPSVRAAACRRLLRATGAKLPAGHPEHPVAVDPRLGADATAWAYARPAPGDRPRLDPTVHLSQREANPLFRIRYAHARTRALSRNAADLGFGPAEGDYPHPAEAALLGAVADYPRVLGAAARHREPDRLARALEGLADAFFDFHDSCPVLPRGDEKPSAAHRARLALADATGTVLAGGLTLLGISAPDHL